MPVLEAMAAGIPVIAGNRSALPEVCGDAAVLVDPESEEELASALLGWRRMKRGGRNSWRWDCGVPRNSNGKRR